MFPPSAIERDGMLTLLIIVCLFASAVGAFLAFRKRRVCSIAATLPFLLVPLALYVVIAFGCYFGGNCP
jgi:hypothetical protein